MSDGMVIPIDGDDTKIRGKLSRIKREAASAGSSFGNASSQAARVGGAAGGAVGRSIGGFQQGMGAGVLGLGLAGGGAFIASFLQRDRERIDMARTQAESQQRAATMSKNAVERIAAVSAGGLQYADKISRAMTLGASKSTLSGYTSMAGKMGLTSMQGIDIFEATSKYQGVDPNDIARAMRTGLFGSADEAAQSIRQSGGLNNAVAMAGKMSPDQAGAVISGQDSDPNFAAIGRARSAANPIANKQIDDLLSGETANVLEAQTKDALNPLAKMAADASAAAMNTVQQLQAAAAEQSTMGALLAEMGRVVGMSEGAETRKLTKFVQGTVLPGG